MSTAQIYDELQWKFMGDHWASYTGYALLCTFSVYLQFAFLPEKVAGLTKALSTTNISAKDTLFADFWKNVGGNESVGGLIGVLIVTYVVMSAVDFFEMDIEIGFVPPHLQHCRTLLFKKLIEKYREEYQDVPPAKVISRINHVSRIFVYQSEYFVGTLFPYVIGLITVIVYCFRRNKIVGTVVSTSLALSIGAAFFWGMKAAQTSKSREKVYMNMVDKMNDSFSNLMNIYVNNKEKDAIASNNRANSEHTEFFRQEMQITRNSSLTTTSIAILGFSLLLGVGFHLVKRKQMKTFDLAAIVTLYIMYMNWSMRVLDGLPTIFRRIGVWLQNVPFVQNILSPHKTPISKDAKIRDGSLIVKDLVFRYPSSKHDVLDDFSCSIRSGERVAIVGRSGMGKTTLMKLIIGLHKPTDGSILVGGVDVRNIDKAKLRNAVNFINQRTTLLNDTIFNNIVFGNGASKEEVDRLLDTYDLRVVFSEVPGGIDAVAGVQGGNLSLGMSKTVMILRGILRKKHSLIYLFDEPVAGLDPITRRKIMNMISTECKGKTIVCVTHLKEIKTFVDRVIELKSKH